nr:MAG TPA: hypothetical protein [Caudoviricetes sp.]
MTKKSPVNTGFFQIYHTYHRCYITLIYKNKKYR